MLSEIDYYLFINFFILRNEDLHHRSLRSAGGWFDSVFSYPSVPQHADRQRWQTETDKKQRSQYQHVKKDIHSYMYIIIYVDNYTIYMIHVHS